MSRKHDLIVRICGARPDCDTSDIKKLRRMKIEELIELAKRERAEREVKTQAGCCYSKPVRYFFRIYDGTNDVTMFANKYNDSGARRFDSHEEGIAEAEHRARRKWALLNK